jgi:hypothetical protein
MRYLNTRSRVLLLRANDLVLSATGQIGRLLEFRSNGPQIPQADRARGPFSLLRLWASPAVSRASARYILLLSNRIPPALEKLFACAELLAILCE